MTKCVFVLMGVSGCGKSSVAKALVEEFDGVFIEGDDLHSKDAKQKMSGGVPLTDEDRNPWLQRIVNESERLLTTNGLVFISCSSLKRDYREKLRSIDGPVCFMHLAIDESISFERVSKRESHFLPTDIVRSQFETLEPYCESEGRGITLDGAKRFTSVCQAASTYVTSVLKDIQ